MTVKEREHKRYMRRLPVRLQSEGIKLQGFTLDVSATGLSMWAKRGFEPTSLVDVFVSTDASELKLKGEVLWCKRETKKETQMFVFVMGIRFFERSQPYIHFLEEVIADTEAKTHREDFHERLTVTYESQVLFWKEYERNLKHRGIFLPTVEHFALREVVSFTVHLLAPMVVLHAEGAVVYIIDEHVAREKGMERGVGIQITRFYYDDEAMFEEIVTAEKDQRGL